MKEHPEIYLTPELKKKYMNDFNNILKAQDIIWPIDSGLPELLNEINANPHIQTIYSKKSSESSGLPESYLEICYSKDVELQLLRYFIKYMLKEFNSTFSSELNFEFIPPTDNSNYEEREKLTGMACLDDPDYFRVNRIQFKFKSLNSERHDEFWEKLKTVLSKVSPESDLYVELYFGIR